MGRFIPAAKMQGYKTTYLSELLRGVVHHTNAITREIQICGIADDSRHIQPGFLFIAVCGHNSDGHQFIPEAKARGCAAILIERGRSVPEEDSAVVVIEVDSTREALGFIAANYYDHPGQAVKMIGITGTNGKTTTAYLTESIINSAGRPGIIGTVDYHYIDAHQQQIVMEAPLTTPGPIILQRVLRQMADSGVSHVIMEVSSHALAQDRLNGLSFDVAVFTNLSRDHLDFHGDMESYFGSKKKLFTHHLKKNGKVVIVSAPTDTAAYTQAESPLLDWGRKLRHILERRQTSEFSSTSQNKDESGNNNFAIVTCSLHPSADLYPKSFSYALRGITAELHTPLGDMHLEVSLVGDFNLKNILAAIGIAICLDIPFANIQKSLSSFSGVPGRLEQIPDTLGRHIFVDYAHTPDALQNVIQSLRNLKPARLICVFGCGGDRDHGKRPLMGKVAGDLCDVVLVTSDNPRTEDPFTIVQEIEKGLVPSSLQRIQADTLLQQGGKGYDIIISRQEAIQKAVQGSRVGEVVLIAGKGHENYQINQDGKCFFDDRLEAEKYAEGGSPC